MERAHEGRGLPALPRRGRAAAAGRRLPHGALPQPRGARRDGPVHRRRRAHEGGAGARQRSGRGSARGDGAGRAGHAAHAHRQRGRRAAGPLPAHPGHEAGAAARGHHHRLLGAARADRPRARAPRTTRCSPASSGSPTARWSASGARARRSSSATRRRSATRWARWCATRTASARRWCSRTWRRGASRAGRRCSATWRKSSAGTASSSAAQRNFTFKGAEGAQIIARIMDGFRQSHPERIGELRRARAPRTTRSARPAPSSLERHRLRAGGRPPRHPAALGHRAEDQVLLRAEGDAERPVSPWPRLARGPRRGCQALMECLRGARARSRAGGCVVKRLVPGFFLCWALVSTAALAQDERAPTAADRAGPCSRATPWAPARTSSPPRLAGRASPWGCSTAARPSSTWAASSPSTGARRASSRWSSPASSSRPGCG